MFVEEKTLDVKPRPVERILPIYPERALKDRVRGVVVVKVLVSENGSVLKAQVDRGVRADIDAAAVAAALQWRFEPARKSDRAVRTFTTVRFQFEGIQFARTPFPLDSPAGSPTATPAPGAP